MTTHQFKVPVPRTAAEERRKLLEEEQRQWERNVKQKFDACGNRVAELITAMRARCRR